MKGYHVKWLLACAVLVVACTEQEESAESVQDDYASLKIHVATSNQTSRSVSAVTDTCLAVGDTIGITMVGAENTNDYSRENVPYSLDSIVDQNQYWHSTNDIILRRPKGTLTAYYPYGKDVYPYAIEINCMDGIDWLYCPWITNPNDFVSARWPDAILTMKHAQGILRVQLRREGYGGDGKVKFITITSQALATKGELDSSSGSIYNTSGNTIDQQYADGAELQLPEDPDSVCVDEWFFLPASAGKKEITFSVKVDKRTLSATTTVNPGSFQRGRIHLYRLKVLSSELELSPVRIIPWETQADTLYMNPTN